jgi:hypothetical protein
MAATKMDRRVSWSCSPSRRAPPRPPLARRASRGRPSIAGSRRQFAGRRGRHRAGRGRILLRRRPKDWRAASPCERHPTTPAARAWPDDARRTGQPLRSATRPSAYSGAHDPPQGSSEEAWPTSTRAAPGAGSLSPLTSPERAQAQRRGGWGAVAEVRRIPRNSPAGGALGAEVRIEGNCGVPRWSRVTAGPNRRHRRLPRKNGSLPGALSNQHCHLGRIERRAFLGWVLTAARAR